MRRAVLLATVAVYAALLVAPLALHALGVRQRVSGALPPDRRPALTWASVTHERFQRGVTRWIENHRSLFGFAVYADNSVLRHGFRETRVGARVVLGRDPRVLFVDEDLGHLNLREVNLPSAAVVDALATRLAALQARLRASGRSLVPVIAPTKPSVFPDQIDPRWRRFDGVPPSDAAVYLPLVAALDRHAVEYVDMRAELTSGRHDRAAVWAPEARHWSDYGACLAWQQIVVRHARLVGGAPLPYGCRLGHEPADRLHEQFDLWRLLNVWGVPRSSDVAPLALHDPPPPSLPPGPRVLLVGTSFQLDLLHDGARSGLLRDLQLHYYDSQLISWPSDTRVPLASGTDAWRGVVEAKDLIVLDLMEAAIWSGHPYLESFLRAAEALPAP